MRATRPPRARALPAPDPDRPAAHRPRQDQRRSQAGWQVPAVHQRSRPVGRGRRAGYKNLLEAERGFRDLKTTIELRPVFHRLEHRIRAHVLLSCLALLLIRVAERQTGHTWRRIALELQLLHLVTLTDPTGTIAQTTELTDIQRELSAATAIPAPPRNTALQLA